MTYSPFRHIDSVFWKRRPIQLTFFLTRRCNARCAFCFYHSGEEGRQQDDSELSLEEIQKLSSSMGSLLWLAFSGGEIFLRDDLVEIAETFYRQNRPSIILFPTNGILADRIEEKVRAVLERCGNSTIVVKLSLDGPEGLHDQIRGVKGSYRRMHETYHRLSGLLGYPNFELGINSVFCQENQDSMDDIIDYVQGLEHIKTHTVSLIRGEGLKSVDLEQYRKVSDRLAENLQAGCSAVYRFRGGRLKAAQDIVQRRLIYETETMKRKRSDCFAGRLNLVLTEKGTLYPCESFDPSMILGNVRDNGFDISRTVQSPQAQRVIHSISADGCFCSHECYLMTNILFNPRMYLQVLREYRKLGG